MRTTTLIDVAEVIDSLHQTPTYVDDGIPMVRVTDVKKGNLSLDKCLMVSEKVYQAYTAKYVPKKGDIVISRVGSYGNFAYVADDFRFCLGQNTAIISPKINSRFLFYFLISPEAKRQIERKVVGSTQKTISLKNIKGIEIPIVDELIQNKIATILECIDDKIATNDKINQNLTSQIQAIYSHEFDPVMHSSTGVLSEISKYSTEKVNVSELSVKTYYSTENMLPNKVGAIDASTLPTIAQTTKCHPGDVLVSNIRPYFKKIVYVNDDCGCSTDVLCFTPLDSTYSAYLFGTLFMDQFFDYMVAGSKGTKMPRGDKQQIMNYPIVIPNGASLKKYNGVVEPMLEQMAANRAESERLIALRDYLLPKLISGALDVVDLNL